jgi:adenosylhomocysteine nucleosidase
MKIQSVAGRRVLFVMAALQEYGPGLRARIDPLICGVGPIEASLTMASCLRQMRDLGEVPNLVVSLGSAGSQTCQLGTVYQVSEVSWRDIDATRLGFPKGVTGARQH